MAEVSFAATTPVSVAKVGIKARDAQALADYYKSVVGLKEISRRPGVIVLGAGDRRVFRDRRGEEPANRTTRAAPVFSTPPFSGRSAPTSPAGRSTRWISRSRSTARPTILVSEAIYLTDPEGNGIEIYADRKPVEWKWEGTNIRMATERLNFPELA